MCIRDRLSAHAELEVPHKKAFGAYLRTGDDDGLRGLQLEGKAMSSAVNADGGYLLDPQTADSIRSMLVSTSSLRSIANVVQIDATSFDVLIDRSEVGSGWATEVAATAETATPTIERISVSYTHLDVYKRQAVPRGEGPLPPIAYCARRLGFPGQLGHIQGFAAGTPRRSPSGSR